MSPKRALAILIVVSGLLRLITACALGLGNDEAYHFLYAIHPDLSYYDHPPMLAWVETAGLALSGSLFSRVALRSGFIALFAASTWLMWRIAGRWYGPRAGFLAALALNLTGYYGLAASTFALPDGPLLFFWLLTIDRLSVALEQPRRTSPWVCVGLAWGGAMLSKYHAIFLPAGMLLFLILHRPLRHSLARPGPYLAVGLGLLVFSPVIIWNASHGWASFLFQGGRAVGALLPRPDYLATAMLAQAGYLFPWIWIPLFLLMVRQARNWRRLESEQARLALCLAVVPVLVFTAVACFRPVLPHWGLIGLVSLFPLLGDTWRQYADRSPGRMTRWLSIAAFFPVVLVAVTIVEHHTGCLQRVASVRSGLFDARTDPTADLYGWELVADRLEELGILDDVNTFLFTRTWYQSAQIAHAIQLRLPVLCYNIDDPRGFAFWSKPAQWLGHDGILLIIDDDFVPVSFYRPWFQDATPLADFTIDRGGRPFRRVQAIRLINQLAVFPFDFSPERAVAREALRAGGHPLGQSQPTARRPSPEGKRSR
jgi:Dolichyl-phosphate-mannose-protein mannosyltransferase